ncbi:MAG: hypothetical protein KatS3mg077_1625 [Candidatus Binatia bacterium]|nr:MAG: hypothetical protein KatS3mg077_1625 [Candidatus Binatia bacterium]
MITNLQSGTNIEEVAERIYRINTPVALGGMPNGFSFNQFLVVDEFSLLFHTGPRRLFPLVVEAVSAVIPASSLRYVGVSHVEADECGSLNEWLAIAPQATPLCGRIAAEVSIADLADRAPRALGDGERLSIGDHTLCWLDTPHVPHAWECGLVFEERTSTLLCGDLFTQPGNGLPAVTEADILGPSESFRAALDYYSHTRHARRILERLAATAPSTLACMHGSVWAGDGASLLRALADELDS